MLTKNECLLPKLVFYDCFLLVIWTYAIVQFKNLYNKKMKNKS